jgi:hypothetical protein
MFAQPLGEDAGQHGVVGHFDHFGPVDHFVDLGLLGLAGLGGVGARIGAVGHRWDAPGSVGSGDTARRRRGTVGRAFEEACGAAIVADERGARAVGRADRVGRQHLEGRGTQPLDRPDACGGWIGYWSSQAVDQPMKVIGHMTSRR